jgi:hypothetical protein
MKEIISNIKTFLIAIVGLIGGVIWAYKSNWEMEPIILLIVSILEIIGFLFLKFIPEENSETKIKNQQNIINKGRVKKQINIHKNKGKIEM